MMKIQTNIFRAALLTAALFLTAEVSAQGLPSLFGKERANNRDRSADIPTTITAESMEVNMGNNIATLMGDVFVDDQEMTISCEKMTIHFEKEKDESAKQDNAAKKENATSGKKPIRIECFESVVIKAKPKPTEDGKLPKEQKATAKKVVYDLVKDVITLYKVGDTLPVINDGESKVSGNQIEIYLNEERMLILRGKASTKETLKK